MKRFKNNREEIRAGQHRIKMTWLKRYPNARAFVKGLWKGEPLVEIGTLLFDTSKEGSAQRLYATKIMSRSYDLDFLYKRIISLDNPSEVHMLVLGYNRAIFANIDKLDSERRFCESAIGGGSLITKKLRVLDMICLQIEEMQKKLDLLAKNYSDPFRGNCTNEEQMEIINSAKKELDQCIGKLKKDRLFPGKH